MPVGPFEGGYRRDVLTEDAANALGLGPVGSLIPVAVRADETDLLLSNARVGESGFDGAFHPVAVVFEIEDPGRLAAATEAEEFTEHFRPARFCIGLALEDDSS